MFKAVLLVLNVIEPFMICVFYIKHQNFSGSAADYLVRTPLGCHVVSLSKTHLLARALVNIREVMALSIYD